MITCSEIEKETEKNLQSSPLVYLACKKRNVETLSYLYSDNKMVIPIEIGDNEIEYVNSFVKLNNLKLMNFIIIMLEKILLY